MAKQRSPREFDELRKQAGKLLAEDAGKVLETGLDAPLTPALSPWGRGPG